jgi:hypothetical protein
VRCAMLLLRREEARAAAESMLQRRPGEGGVIVLCERGSAIA